MREVGQLEVRQRTRRVVGISVLDSATLEKVQNHLVAAGADIGAIQKLGDC